MTKKKFKKHIIQLQLQLQLQLQNQRTTLKETITSFVHESFFHFQRVQKKPNQTKPISETRETSILSV
jgi:hypothetical protein